MKKMFRVEERPLFPHHSVPPKPLHAPKTRLHKKKYTVIITILQLFINQRSYAQALGVASVEADAGHSPYSCMRDQGWGCKTVRHFYCRYFKSQPYIYCAHASCRICGPRGHFLFVGETAAEFKKTHHEDNTLCLPNTCVGKGNTLQQVINLCHGAIEELR